MPTFVVSYKVTKPPIKQPLTRVSRVEAAHEGLVKDEIKKRAAREGWKRIEIVSVKRATIQEGDPRKGTF